MEVTTDIEDKDFEKYLENPTLRLPNEIGVMSLYLK